MAVKEKVLDQKENSMIAANEGDTAEILPIGKILKKARLKRKGTLPRIAADLKIRQIYLKALEEGSTSDLPEPVFTLGFLRSYALYLELDAQNLLERYQEEYKQTKKPAGFSVQRPLSEEGIPKKSILIVSLVVSLVIAVGWGLYQRYQNTPVQVLSEPIVQENTPQPDIKGQVFSAEEVRPPQEISEILEDQILEVGQIIETVGQGQEPSLVAEKSLSSAISNVTLKAMERTWIALVREGDGRVLENRILSKGDSIDMDLEQGLVLSVGNAGGVFFEIQGKLSPPLGKSGEVLRQIPLTRDLIWSVANSSKN